MAFGIEMCMQYAYLISLWWFKWCACPVHQYLGSKFEFVVFPHSGINPGAGKVNPLCHWLALTLQSLTLKTAFLMQNSSKVGSGFCYGSGALNGHWAQHRCGDVSLMGLAQLRESSPWCNNLPLWFPESTSGFCSCNLELVPLTFSLLSLREKKNTLTFKHLLW